MTVGKGLIIKSMLSLDFNYTNKLCYVRMPERHGD